MPPLPLLPCLKRAGKWWWCRCRARRALLLPPCLKRARRRWCGCCCRCCARKERGGGDATAVAAAAAVLEKSGDEVLLPLPYLKRAGRRCCCCCCCRHALRSYLRYKVLTSSAFISPFPLLHPVRVLSHLHTFSLPVLARLASTRLLPYLEGAVAMATRCCACRLCCVRVVRASMPAVSACALTVHVRACCSASAPVVSCDALVVVFPMAICEN